MGQKGFYFDQTRCTGCRTCSVACSDLHNYAPDIVLRRVIEFEGGTWKVNTNGTCTQNVFAYYTSIGCNECDGSSPHADRGRPRRDRYGKMHRLRHVRESMPVRLPRARQGGHEDTEV